ncbi:hypothetical protein C3369_00780 [Escherichia sp. ESNIH1]|uniref:hypothetical protein n=1 Tax=Escherichia sp. ESNIH1 TaxID=1985876 RepID=UPI000CDDE64A|nr:hypothetical protein [Escherichia sp. ESNIH1]POU03931.1 hypothetical protein C3369_00780 [Escherichia sp. ESNIH1]
MKRLQVMAGYLITGAASAGVACLFVLAVVLFCQVAETGSAADWVASVANAIMAITAVFAFIVARSWLPQLTTQEGYKLAIQLVNDHYIWLGPQNSLLREAGLPMAYIRHFQDGKTMADSTVTYENIMASLDESLLEHKKRRDTMDKIRFRLGTYGLYETHSVRARFEALDGAYLRACDAAATLRAILSEMNERLKVFPNYRPGSGMGYNQPVDDMLLYFLEYAEKTYETLEKEFKRMVQTHKVLFDARPTIGTLFEVKK